MSDFRMTVTADDLVALDAEAFDAVWTALGVLLREHTPLPAVGLVDALEGALGGELVHVNDGSAEARAMGWSDGYSEGFADGERGEQAPSPDPAEEVVPTPPPPATRRATVPLGEATVVCDPGCGLSLPQASIGSHRRTCEAVLKFKAERGVTVVPDLFGAAAPLPDVPASDFDEKRQANAHEASERTWRQTHLDVVDPAGLTAAEVRRAGKALTPHQAEVLAAVREHRGIRTAAEARGWTYQAVANVMSLLRRSGRLPADVANLLAQRQADGWKLRRASAEAAS